MFGERRVMDDGWAERARGEIQDRNRETYQSALNRAKNDYKNADWLTKLTSGITEGNYLKRHGFTDEMNQYGNQGLIGVNDFHDYKSGVERKLTADMEKGTGAVDFLNHVPLIGGILNYITQPIAQVAGAARDIGTDDWNKRDHVSDAAALGQIGIGALTAGFGAPATLAGKIGFGATTGAAENALDTLRQTGQSTNGGDLLGSAAIGAAFGGGIPIAGRVLGNITGRGAEKLTNKALAQSGFGAGVPQQQFTKAAMDALGAEQYAALLNNAKSGIGGKLASFGAGAMPRTKLGKTALIGGGVGLGGFGLSKLLGGGGQPQMTDEDLAALYNYYGTGGF